MLSDREFYEEYPHRMPIDRTLETLMIYMFVSFLRFIAVLLMGVGIGFLIWG